MEAVHGTFKFDSVIYVVKRLGEIGAKSVKKMKQKVRARADLKFKRPEAVEFDYSREVTTDDMRALDKAMMEKSGLTATELHEAMTDGILVSGEEW